MNVYWIDGGLRYRYYDPEPPERLVGVFCAETREQAKRDALIEWNNDTDWLSLRSRLLAKGLDLPRGVFDENCPEGPWDDDPNVAPPEPWATVWGRLGEIVLA